MDRAKIAMFARTLGSLSAATGVPIPHAVLRGLTLLPGSDWTLVDGAVFGGIADVAAQRRHADPALWEA